MLCFTTALGTCALTWNATGVAGVTLPRTRELAPAEPVRSAGAPEPVRAAAAAITRLLAGEPEDLRDVVLDESGLDPFAARVYAAARATGPGELTTYGALARAVDAPGAARAVGAALAANPYPIVVPCHRVLAADGALTGFSAPGGVATKRRMLEIEGAPGFRQQPLFA